jgi:hypothetical protein
METNIHLFHCKHPRLTRNHLVPSQKTYNGNQNYGVNEMTYVIKQALQTTGTQWKPNSNTEDEEVNMGIRDQSEIGWDHILFGWISQSITNYITSNLHKRESKHGRTQVKNGPIAQYKTFGTHSYNYEQTVMPPFMRTKARIEMRYSQKDCGYK